VLGSLEIPTHPALLVGVETMDDAGVVRISDDLALVQTIDVFPPVVDDPYWYGRIAAANSLSDIYAMGARPIAAVNFVGYPMDDLGAEVLAQILQGSFDALAEADCAMAGGHTIQDSEVKFGLCVVGTVHPDRLVKNSGARPGDRLVLTKPLGIGCLTTALKQGTAAPEHVEAAQHVMARLNRRASEAMLRAGVHAATDVTGYGLLGHAHEMAEGSGVSLRIRADDVPVLAEAVSYVDAKYACGGARRNRAYADGRVQIGDDVTEYHRILLHDVQTSGGLLLATPSAACDALLADLRDGGDAAASAVGEIVSDGPPIVVS
jgi:selenide,water dikinase